MSHDVAMTPALIVPVPGQEACAQALASSLDAEVGEIELRAFPDGETYLRFMSALAGRSVALVCSLDRPNDKLVALLFAAATARELGAARVGLVAPYLAYMRQDRRFQPGEAVTSRQIAALLSDAFDWLVTVDPHLHRYASLAEIYRIPTRVVHAAPLIARCIRSEIQNPFIIGPDSESQQWVAAVAREAAAPYSMLEKIRHGDRDVEIRVRDLGGLAGHTPVLVDDIISSGRTMLQAVRLVAQGGRVQPVCIAVHGVFADRSDLLLAQAGATVVTSNSIPHATNRIDVHGLLAEAVRELAGQAVTPT
jgi:ribose-phosphate pyrophosphokinase